MAQTYLVAWDGDEPVGHAHIAWTGAKLGVPAIQDVFVVETWRRRGIASHLVRAAERLAAERGHTAISVGHATDNAAARAVYERLGYRDAGVEPERHRGTIVIRGRPVHVDDTVVYLVKDVTVDSSPVRSS